MMMVMMMVLICSKPGSSFWRRTVMDPCFLSQRVVAIANKGGETKDKHLFPNIAAIAHFRHCPKVNSFLGGDLPKVHICEIDLSL